MSDDARIEDVKAELIITQAVTLPQIGAAAIDLAERCDMLGGKLKTLSATSSNDGLERTKTHLNTAYELLVKAREQVDEATGSTGDALALM